MARKDYLGVGLVGQNVDPPNAAKPCRLASPQVHVIPFRGVDPVQLR